jgi:flagellar hook-associated protein 1
VTVSDVSRDYSVFINRQLQAKSIEYGEEMGRSGSLTELERIFNVSEDNLASQINDFFDAWQELTANPSGQVERDVVMQRGELLGDAFRGITHDIDTVVQNMNTEIISEVEYLNEKITQIAKLNDRISLVEFPARPPMPPVTSVTWWSTASPKPLASKPTPTAAACLPSICPAACRWCRAIRR